MEFEVRDRDCFFIEASGVAGCRVRLEHLVRRSDGKLLEYFTVDGAPTDRVLSLAADAPGIVDARLVNRGVDGGLFEFVVSGPCVTTTLADSGAIARSVAAEDGVGHVVASVPPHVDVRSVVETFRDRHACVDLVARRDADREVPVRTKSGGRVALTESLTEKQQEVLRTAYLGGYFAWPRKSTAEECAEALGIAQPTFSQHVRVAQEKVFDELFDGTDSG
ncbi:bacterio-opsin activator HTH domain protein [Halalkaliarchaeum desulfuricum]|uniref:Bacterio-opsin activator HTH domain protein n=1 Tax=Halalkaliarchaeum desulfuricum TaxID=2055893 RepID=A0A343TP10_9EURY|nr:bacterio-opsin activator HTH domain protein [Halalkaliarchaeum desulfuricum]